ncbi:MAG: O-methyltransferase [Chitinophagales bacterium]|nr:O-methyltransferase [Chitinophagales bacterium]MDW8427266.1 O-methyltransferase [Chitinophagales bacterium]
MHFLDPRLENFVEQYTSEPGIVLEQIDRDTYARHYMPQMLSGKVVGRFLSLISKILQPRCIIDIGTFTGYSAICLSEGLHPEGVLYTIDINDELENTVRANLALAGVAHRVKYLIGNAVELLPNIQEIPELVFIDADKENYPTYYTLVRQRLRPGGIIIADNVLWSGKVVEPNPDADTRGLLKFCQMVKEDAQVEHVVLSVRDGLMLIRKKGTPL